ncbi:MAG TPA: ABC transporter permease [Bacteroidales bacterium]|nr:ABC transporter permease [Bacteroidales bacterium]
MWKNYLVTAIRNMFRQKLFTFINILGLSIGIACSVMIFLWVQDELSYNKFHKSADNIYRVVQDQYYSDREAFHVTVTPAGLAPVLSLEYPDFKYVTRYNQWGYQLLTSAGDKHFFENIKATDSTFFKIFSFPFLEGDPQTALRNITSVVITHQIAKKYFGDDSPLGKTITLNGHYALTVTGVVADIPNNSSIKFDFLVPFRFMKELGSNIEDLGNNSYYTFVMLPPGISEQEASAKIKNRLRVNNDEGGYLYLQSLTKMHLYNLGGGGGIVNVKIFSIIAVFILLIACINFMNLSTARASKRAREIGIRKVIGASRGKLISQFIGESLIVSIIAVFFAMIFVETMLPTYNQITGKNLILNYNPQTIGILAIITVLTGLVAGSYPAFLLSSFRPVKVLKSKNFGSNGSPLFRKILVVFQFSLSIILIICTIIIHKQLAYLQNKELGINKDNVAYIQLKGNMINKMPLLKDRLLENKDILSISFSNSFPCRSWSNGGGWNWQGKDPETNPLVTTSSVDYDFAKVFDIKLDKGRFLSADHPSDTVQPYGIVVNETFAKIIGKKDIIGTILTNWGNNSFQVIGVAKDFHFTPATEAIGPMVMFNDPSRYSYMFIRINGKRTPETIDYIKKVYSSVIPGYPFDYDFVDAVYSNLYKGQAQQQKIFGIFAFLAIFISCLGLFGLSTYLTEQRTKEIGIRKVMGASVYRISVILSREFAWLVLIANLIAWPLAYFYLKSWMQDYAYHIDIHWWIFLFAGLIALSIAMVTISIITIRAANSNPTNSLRYE